eukprot:Skav214247  [mRNA]  locus=scaffold2045:320658:332345:- [translate_table: standard]
MTPQVDDLKVHHREFFGGTGSYTVLKHQHMSQSKMSGSFTSTVSTGGTTEYRGCFNGDPHEDGPIPNGLGVRVNPDGSSYSGEWKAATAVEHLPHGKKGTVIIRWMVFRTDKESGRRDSSFDVLINRDIYEGDWLDGKFQEHLGSFQESVLSVALGRGG